jgi:hypothetical protein
MKKKFKNLQTIKRVNNKKNVFLIKKAPHPIPPFKSKTSQEITNIKIKK